MATSTSSAKTMIVVDGNSLSRESRIFIEKTLLKEAGLTCSQAFAYLAEVGAKALSSEGLRPLFESGVLPDIPTQEDKTTRDVDGDPLLEMASAPTGTKRSFDNAIIDAMMMNLIKTRFTGFVPYAFKHPASLFPTRDSHFRFFCDLSERYNKFVFSYSIATRESELTPTHIEQMKKWVGTARSSIGRYIGHLFLNASPARNPGGIPDFFTETVGEKKVILVWMQTKDILKDTDLVNQYIVDAISAFTLLGKNGLKPVLA